MRKQLVSYLLGEHDGQAKNPKYIFKLYMLMGNFAEAAKSAVAIAQDEQSKGNYRQAHDLLLDCYRKLRKSGSKIPADLDRMLAVLHSYIQVKTMVKLDDHDTAARLLKRVADNISKFPARIF
jgi:WD repeat-containing protein 19